jgi:aerobic carbon-monoxide dehydrogenase large subunit
VIAGKLRDRARQIAAHLLEASPEDIPGRCLGASFTAYLLPSSKETPRFELYETVTPSPHHPIGAKGVGESATVGSPAAYVNAVVDALAQHGVRELTMPVTSAKVWEALDAAGLTRP